MTSAFDIERFITETAHRQHGVISRAQLVVRGIADSSIHHRVRTGRLHRIHPGVYAVGHASLSRTGRLMAACLAGGHSAAISHLTAACEWNISRINPSSIDLLVPRNHRGGLDGVTVRRTRELPGWQTTQRRGVRRTNVSRTIVDLTDVLTEWQLTNVMNEASRRSLLDLRRLERLISQLRGRHGLVRVRRAIDMHRSGSAGTKSDLEDLFLALVISAGIEPPIVNVEVRPDARSWELDFHWPRHRLNVEVDGGSGHLVPYRSARDVVRDEELQSAGWTVLRFTGDQVRYESDAVIARVREALSGAGA